MTVIIDKREYAITCGDGQEAHILELGRFLDAKAKEFFGGSTSINENMKLAMLGLFLADELSDMKSGNLQAVTPQNVQQLDSVTAKKIDVQTEKLVKIINDVKSI
ncbi:MAG: cell division protein ZapA [Alphaproteobacteria bacterium]|nr:cell division protein ZapA [Alphaproteobacteria bacterium]